MKMPPKEGKMDMKMDKGEGKKETKNDPTGHKHTFVKTASGNRKVCTMCGEKAMA